MARRRAGLWGVGPTPRTRRGLRGVPVTPAGTWLASQDARKLHRPYTVPVEFYRGRVTESLTGAVASVTFNSAGAGTAQVGPQGLGTLWKVTMAAISTTTGQADTSTAVVYVGTQGLASVQAAQSYAGGGDTAGLNDAELTPGLYVIATWTGAVAGAVGTLIVYGTETSLIVALCGLDFPGLPGHYRGCGPGGWSPQGLPARLPRGIRRHNAATEAA